MTHPAKDLLIAIAEGKQMEIFARWAKWEKATVEAALIQGIQKGWDTIRIARPMVTRTVTYPEPLRVKPEMGEKYWTIGPESERPAHVSWTNHRTDNNIFNAGMAFATEQDAAEAHKALFGGGND